MIGSAENFGVSRNLFIHRNVIHNANRVTGKLGLMSPKGFVWGRGADLTVSDKHVRTISILCYIILSY